jgi:hypothetical protein
MNAREGTELVVALHKERVVWAIERKADGAPFGEQLVRVLRKERELCQAGPARHCGEGEQVDTALSELREDAIRRRQLVTDVRVVVLDAADRERHRALASVSP